MLPCLKRPTTLSAMQIRGFKDIIRLALNRAGYSVTRLPQVPRSALVPPLENGLKKDVMKLLHSKNPYEDFDFRSYPFDAHGWQSHTPAFRTLITQTKPRLIIEVGTWKGASALEMAARICELGLPTEIVCVDTWLGALEFWTNQNDPTRYLSLQLKHGYPTVYYQFLANVCHQGFQERIIPFPQTSFIASLWFMHHGITADMIYIDASHEEKDVYEDLNQYWNILSENGVIFGDDYTWEGVRRAVNRFAAEKERQVQFVYDKWILLKNTMSSCGV